MSNFLETLKEGELPIWNEYIGCGHPMLLFGHYPITQNTIIYMLFGFNDFTYDFTKFLGLIILLLSTTYAFKYLGFSYMVALIGALTYFSINFVIRILPAETIGNLLFVYPLLMIFIVKIIDENRKKDILIFSLFYIFWLTGGHIVYVYMHMIMFTVFYLITVVVFYKTDAFRWVNLKRFIPLYFVLFIIPYLAVLYQYYFIYDVVSASNRLKEGLVVSPFESAVWRQLIVSFQSSSYFWVGLFLLSISGALRLLKIRYSFTNITVRINPWMSLLLLFGLFYVISTNIQITSKSNIIVDFIPILNSAVFRIAFLLYLVLNITLSRATSVHFVNLREVFTFLIYIFLLSYYFYSPENIIGDVNGYDYDLFRELSIPFQILFTLSILSSSTDYQKNRVVKIVVLSSIVLYFLRSHFTIPLLRFTGIVWYATRDGSIFSVFFAILFMYGLRNMLSYLSQVFKNYEGPIVKFARYGFLISLLMLMVCDASYKFYKGTSHRFIFPNKKELAKSSMEEWVIKARAMEEIAILEAKLKALNKETKHFYRLFSPENHYILAGYLQHHKIYEAFIYESSISKTLQNLYYFTILGRNPSRDLKNLMPYFLFTRHVHAGLGMEHKQIAYDDFYMSLAKYDTGGLQSQNIEFLWDIMQVKYLLVGPEFSQAIENFATREYYKLLERYSTLNLNLYEILKDKSYSKFAILPLDNRQSYDEMIRKLNSADTNALRALYVKLVFLDANPEGFTLAKNQSSKSARHYEISSKQDAILIDFESWNHNWELKVNDKGEKLLKAFQMFKGIRLQPGLNQIELTYHLKYFKELFILSIFVILIYIVLLGRIYYVEKNNKKIG